MDCPKIIIVGAGASGLYAAYKLRMSGFDISVFEATHKHGGRIRELNGFADFPIMLGAEYVQGRKNKNQGPLSFLNSDIDSRNPKCLVDIESYKTVFALDNTWVWNDYTDTEIETLKAFMQSAYLYKGSEMSVAEHLKTLGVDSESRTWHLYEAFIGSEYGTSVRRMSMKGWAKERDSNLTGDKSWVLNESYLKLLDRLYFDSVKNNIVFNRKVEKIFWTGNKVCVVDNIGNESHCDAVLITVPLSVLKNKQIKFLPELPESKSVAINGIGMDKGMKIIFKFSKSWWPEKMYDAFIKGFTSIVWTPAKSFTNATDNILTAYIMGEKYDYLTALNDDAIEIVLKELDELFGNGVASDSFIAAHISDWGKEDSFQGVYSYPIADTYSETGLSKRQLLANPINDCLFFAGEATSNEHSATVHGALESGSRAADEIISSFQQQ